MSDFHDVIDKYSNKVVDENINSFSELEQLIFKDTVFKKLDDDEQTIILDVIKDKFKNKKPEKVENNQVNTNNNNKQQETPMYKFKQKSVYEFVGKNETEESKTDKKVTIPEKKPYKFNPSYRVLNNTDMTGKVYIDPTDTTEGALLSSVDKAVFIDVVPEELYLRRKIQYEFIRAIESPEQRTPPWFAQRNKSITASDCGSVIGENKHEPVYGFVIKKVFGQIFGTNVFCYHGKKFENVVTLMYELINDVIVEEFGLLGHPVYNFLAASPDGICAPYCRDKVTPSPLVGRMIEIKCPYQRKIKYSGDVKGDVCPDYYWCQVQLQLECCDLDECDFVQCSIEEYKSRQDYLDDTNATCDYKSKTYGIERGVVIELMPTKLPEEDYFEYTVRRDTKDGTVYDKHYAIKDDAVYDKAIFIYQPKLDMTQKELDDWIIDEMEKLSKKDNVKLNKIIYWRFVERNCTLIKRDKVWFNKNLETMRKIWAFVEILRKNSDIAEEWKTWIDAQNKKYNEKVMNKLVELIKNAGLFDIVLNAIKEVSPEMVESIDKFVNVIEESKSDTLEQEEIKDNIDLPIENITDTDGKILVKKSNNISIVDDELLDISLLNEEFSTKITVNMVETQEKSIKSKKKKEIKESTDKKERKSKKKVLDSDKVNNSVIDIAQLNTIDNLDKKNSSKKSSKPKSGKFRTVVIDISDDDN